MSQALVLEGTGAELIHHLEAHPEQRFRLTELPRVDEALKPASIKREPNWKALDVMRKIAERQKGRPYTDGSNSLKYLHEARDGEMYDYDPAVTIQLLPTSSNP